MSVYVDNQRAAFGRMKMSHLMADTTEELLAMVDRIGVQRKWIQAAGTPREHFDIAAVKRELAIVHGAIPVSSRFLVDEVVRRKRARLPSERGAGKR